jgi:alcohol dehydrogenase (NADP+)
LKGDCPSCASGSENYCQVASTHTYNSKWPSGEKAYGGYAKYWRGDNNFVFAIPDAVSSAEAAPMLCGGVTLYSPLKQNGCGPGKRVGIVGIGGLGHFGLLWAKALGADKVVAISRTDAKKEDAFKMGADEFIATAEEGYEKTYANSLDLIVSTVSGPGLPINSYLSLLDIGGQFIQVGAPEDPIPQFMAFALILKKVKIGGSLIGSPAEIREMLQLAADKNIHPWINERPMEDANKTIVDFEKGVPRYRFVLKN